MEEVDSDFLRYFEEKSGDWRIRKTLRLKDLPDQIILVLAMLSFNGFNKHAGNKICQNRFFTNRSIEYLIRERNFSNAVLAKELILKYGFQEYMAPDTEGAKNLFEQLHLGREELHDLTVLRGLESIPTKHGSQIGTQWQSHQELELSIAKYHPDNING
jgi:hypothetical protein